MFKSPILKMQNNNTNVTAIETLSNNSNVQTYVLRLVASTEEQVTGIQRRLEAQGRTVGDTIVDQFGYLTRQNNVPNPYFVNVRNDEGVYTQEVIQPLSLEQLTDATIIGQVFASRIRSYPNDNIDNQTATNLGVL